MYRRKGNLESSKSVLGIEKICYHHQMAYLFNQDNFKKIISKLQSLGFVFETNPKSFFPAQQKICLMRHDVDYDMIAAEKMASIENQLGVKAVYLVQLFSNLYTIFEESSIRSLQNIMELGHEIGIHFDPSKEYLATLEQQVEILSKITGKPIIYLSNHNPTLNYRNSESATTLENLYSDKYLIERKYISDSNMKPREEFDAVFEKFFRIHFLIHPEFWVWETQDIEEFQKSFLFEKEKALEAKSLLLAKQMNTSLTNRYQLDKEFDLRQRGSRQ